MVLYRKPRKTAVVNKKTIQLLKTKIKQTITSENNVLNILGGVLKLLDSSEKKKIISTDEKKQLVLDIEKCIQNTKNNVQDIKNININLSALEKNKNDSN